MAFRFGRVFRPSWVSRAVVGVSFVCATTACTSEGPSAAPSGPPMAVAQCTSPSRILEGGVNGTEVEGLSTDGITLYGQVQSEEFFVASRGERRCLAHQRLWRTSRDSDRAQRREVESGLGSCIPLVKQLRPPGR